jgi:hypothetical protein
MIKRITTANTPPPRLGLNVGAGLDLLNGNFIKDYYGDDVLMGGVTPLQGVMGDPNSDKTAMTIYMTGAASNTIAYSYMQEILGYDAEGTLRVERVNSLLERFEYLDRDEYGNVVMDFSSIAEMSAEEWYDKKFAPYVKAKRDSKEYEIDMEFLADPNDKSKLLKVKLPTLMFIDTVTFFNPSTSIDLVMGENKKKGGSNDGSNKTIGLNNAKFKTDIMSTLTPSLLRTNTYGLLVAHVGDNINMDNNPYGPKPRQQLGTLASNEKIKGVPADYTRLTTGIFQTNNKTPLYNQESKLAEYPIGNDMDTFRNELNTITVKQHRSKDNMSSLSLELISSQSEGIQPHLSQFRRLKKANDYGMIGNKLSYSLVLYPEQKLSRTTVRSLINNDSKLRRALELTDDYYLLTLLFPKYGLSGLYCGLEKLYKDIDEMGYDWNKILTMTRGWWTPKQYSSELKYLHMLNILKIRAGLFNNKETLKAIKKDPVKESK